MYIEVNNPNEIIRNWAVETFNDSDINDIDAIAKIIEEFYSVKNTNPEFYEQILKTLYQDYKVMSRYTMKMYKEFLSVNEIENELNNNPTFYIDMLINTFKFYNKDILEKKYILLKTKEIGIYMKELNPMYVMDVIEYCKDFVKEDLICCYYESYNNINGDTCEKEMYAIDDVIDLIYELEHNDFKSYRNLLKEIIDEGYLYLRSETDNRKIKKHEYLLLSKIEKSSFEQLNNAAMDLEDEFLVDIVDSFIKYNKKPVEEQNKIKSKIWKRGNK